MSNGGEKSLKDFEEKHYHMPDDDMSVPIDWAAGAKFARLNYLIAHELADSRATPRWYAGDYFGNRFAPSAPKAAKH